MLLPLYWEKAQGKAQFPHERWQWLQRVCHSTAEPGWTGRAGRLPVKQLWLHSLTCPLQRHHTRSPSRPCATTVWTHGGHECLPSYPKAEVFAVLFLNRGEKHCCQNRAFGMQIIFSLVQNEGPTLPSSKVWQKDLIRWKMFLVLAAV